MTTLELVSSVKVIRLPKNETNMNVPIIGIIHGGFEIKSKIIYEDSMYLCNLDKKSLLEIIEEKNIIMNKVIFNGDRFAMQNQLTKEEFTFIRICDDKRISRKALVL